MDFQALPRGGAEADSFEAYILILEFRPYSVPNLGP